MNVTISKLFDTVLCVLHVVALLAFIMTILTGGMKGALFAVIGFVVYVLFVGLACTILAIREHLETIVKNQSLDQN